jgi:hypothetical protein
MNISLLEQDHQIDDVLQQYIKSSTDDNEDMDQIYVCID